MSKTRYIVKDADGREIDIGVAATFGTGRLGQIAAEIQRVAQVEYFGAIRQQSERVNMTELGRREFAESKARPILKRLAELRREAITEGTAAHAQAFDTLQAKLREVAPMPDSVSVHVMLEHARILAADFKLRHRLTEVAKNGVAQSQDIGYYQAILRMPPSLTKVDGESRATIERALAPQEVEQFFGAVQAKADLASMAARAAREIVRDAGLSQRDLAAVDQSLADAVIGSQIAGDVPANFTALGV